jgi:hypothetical protein
MICNCFGVLNLCKGKGEPAEERHEQGKENEYGFIFFIMD